MTLIPLYQLNNFDRRQAPGAARISPIDSQSVARRQPVGVADIEQFKRRAVRGETRHHRAGNE
jgi:hypothetical protein